MWTVDQLRFNYDAEEWEYLLRRGQEGWWNLGQADWFFENDIVPRTGLHTRSHTYEIKESWPQLQDLGFGLRERARFDDDDSTVIRHIVGCSLDENDEWRYYLTQNLSDSNALLERTGANGVHIISLESKYTQQSFHQSNHLFL